eukprot:m51a1_g5021 putative nucleolar protein (554) ;mRNA; r:330130-332044
MVDVVLYESATGYALFDVAAGEDVGATLDSMQESIQSLAAFGKVVSLRAFLPFKSSEDALENANAVSEGVLHAELKEFLESNVDKGQVLGVSEDKLASAVAEACGLQCNKTRAVLELHRGIRQHFSRFIKELKEGDLDKAQLGLGHSYSRSKVKFNVNRADNMIIQSICLLDQLDKDVNTFAMRAREWYSWHFPELVRIVPDNYQYARCARLVGDKAAISDELVPQLAEILEGDEDRARQVVEAARTSMGYEISELDLASLQTFAERVIRLSEYKKRLHEYLSKKMGDIAPNLSALIGEVVGARLISHAGSLTNLAKYPASTVQILGAEKALFRALKTRGNTPKYGLIYHSSFIGKAAARNKGRISRYLANKASIASRIDSFNDVPTSKFGEMLRAQVEERLKFYESGEAPRKNLDVMREAITEAEAVRAESSKKAKKAAAAPAEDVEMAAPEEEAPAPAKTPKSSKKAKKAAAPEAEEEEAAPVPAVTPKSSKKAKKAAAEPEAEEEAAPAAVTPKSSKKSKKAAAPVEEEEPAVTPKSSKKKSKRAAADDE